MEKRIYTIDVESIDFRTMLNKFDEWQKEFHDGIRRRAIERRLFISEQIDRELYEKEIKSL
jgi:hypothetical protein